MRVLHVTPYYEEAWAYGGIPRAASAVCRGLVALGHEVTVATTDACDAAGRLARGRRPRSLAGSGGVRVQVFPNLSNRLAYGRQLFVPLGLQRWLADEARGFDVAHVHGHHHLPGVLAGRACEAAGVPYVVAPHGLAPRTQGQRWGKWIFDTTLGRRVLPQATRVLALTEAERRQLIELGVDPSRLRVVPNPLEPEALGAPGDDREVLRRRLGCDRVVLYLGTLIPRKCVDVLVRAVAGLGERVGLAIAGNDMGSGAAVRRVVERLGLEARVRFLGLVRGDERASLLAAADVVAYPGREELFGLVPLEALLCGTPVVVADDSGCGEVIQQVGGGLLVPPGRSAPLTSALERVLADPADWRRSASEAGVRVRERYDRDRVAARLEAVYRELVA
jgi:glycosyltransferase involved in cell wall biosynthesis